MLLDLVSKLFLDTDNSIVFFPIEYLKSLLEYLYTLLLRQGKTSLEMFALALEKNVEAVRAISLLALLISILTADETMAKRSLNRCNARKTGLRVLRDGVKEVWILGKLDPAGIVRALMLICQFRPGGAMDSMLGILSKPLSVKKMAAELRKVPVHTITAVVSSSYIQISLLSEGSSKKSLATSYYDMDKSVEGSKKDMRLQYQHYKADGSPVGEKTTICLAVNNEQFTAHCLMFDMLGGSMNCYVVDDVSLNQFTKTADLFYKALESSSRSNVVEGMVKEADVREDDDADARESFTPSRLAEMTVEGLESLSDPLRFPLKGLGSKTKIDSTRKFNLLSIANLLNDSFDSSYDFKSLGPHVDPLYAQKYLLKVPMTEIKSFLSNGNSPLAYGMSRFASSKGSGRIDINSFSSNHDPKDQSPIYLHFSLFDLLKDNELVLGRNTGSEERDLSSQFKEKRGRRVLEFNSIQRYMPGEASGEKKLTHCVDMERTVSKSLPKVASTDIFPESRYLLNSASIALKHGVLHVTLKLQKRVKLSRDPGMIL